jgi:hypothetical protein
MLPLAATPARAADPVLVWGWNNIGPSLGSAKPVMTAAVFGGAPLSQLDSIATVAKLHFEVSIPTAVSDSWIVYNWSGQWSQTVSESHQGDGTAVSDTWDLEGPFDTSLNVSVGLGVWEKRSVSFDSNGGNGSVAPVANTQQHPEYEVTLPDGGFTRNGYELVGWNTQVDGKGTKYALDGEYTLAGPADQLFAQWASTVKLESVFGQPVTPTSGDGSMEDPYQVSASVKNDVAKLTTADLTVDQGFPVPVDADLTAGTTTVVNVDASGPTSENVVFYQVSVWRDADVTELTELLDSMDLLIAQDVLKGYDAASVAKVKTAIDDGRKLIESMATTQVTQAQIDAAKAALLGAVSGLVPSAPETPDVGYLQLLIKASGKLNPARFTTQTWAVVKSKLAAAQKVLASATDSKDVAKVAKAKKELLAALAALKLDYVKQVRAQVTSVNIAKGKTFTVGALAYLDSGRAQTLTYKSSNSKVAKVDSTGKVTGLKVGSATITATSQLTDSKGKKLSVKIKVKVVKKAKKVAKVSAKIPKSMRVGSTGTITAGWTKGATPGQVVFTSGDWSVAKVDRTGRITALAAGTVKIRVRAGTKSKWYTIRVGAVTPATPKISGKAIVGRTLKAVATGWAPAGLKLSYQWYRNGKAIKGATKASYKLVKADKGKTLKVKVTGAKAGFKSASKVSKATARVS